MQGMCNILVITLGSIEMKFSFIVLERFNALWLWDTGVVHDQLFAVINVFCIVFCGISFVAKKDSGRILSHLVSKLKKGLRRN